MSIDKNHRQRGNDVADAPLLIEGDDSAKELEVAIGAVESNQANNKAADELEAALSVKAKEPATAMFGFWRNFRSMVGTRSNRTAFRITTAHNADNPDQSLIVHLFALACPSCRGLAEGSRNQRKCAQAFGVELRNVEALADVPSLALPEGGYPKCGTAWSTSAPATRGSGW